MTATAVPVVPVVVIVAVITTMSNWDKCDICVELFAWRLRVDSKASGWPDENPVIQVIGGVRKFRNCCAAFVDTSWQLPPTQKTQQWTYSIVNDNQERSGGIRFSQPRMR